ncbi:MAG: 6-phosphogluconolactonase [Cyclobacteriaceae bacterium]
MSPTINVYPTGEEVAQVFAKFLADFINKGRCNIALSGGSTPKRLFQILAESYNQSINWSNVHFYWGDERCVPPGDSESNYLMTSKNLFDHISIPSENIHRVLGENDPAGEAIRYGQEIEKNLRHQNGIPQFDLIILGMGDDGHTASIFPHEMRLLTDPNTCVTATHPTSGQIRVSLSGSVINNASTVVFLVTGEKKKEKVDTILNDQHDAEIYPAFYIRPNQGKLIWMLDQTAKPI